MKYKQTLKVILECGIVVTFIFGTNGKKEIAVETLILGMILMWVNFVASESWLTDKGLEVGLYSDSRNPLYLQGFFRKYSWEKQGESIWSELKGYYFFQINRVVQAVVIWAYGIYNHYMLGGKEQLKVWYFFIAWIVLNFAGEMAVKSRYISLLRNDLKNKKYCPFQYRECIEAFNEKPSEYACSQGNLNNMKDFFQKEILKDRMTRSKVFHVDEKTAICFYYMERGNTVRIYARARTDILKKEHLSEFDCIFQEFVESHISDKAHEKEWYCVLFFEADNVSECLMDIVEKSIFQSEKKYRLPVGICLKERKIYIPTQKELYKMDKYQDMKKTAKDILGLV